MGGFEAVPGVKLADGSFYRMIAFAVENISLKPLQLVNLHEQQLLQGMSSLPASVCRTTDLAPAARETVEPHFTQRNHSPLNGGPRPQLQWTVGASGPPLSGQWKTVGASGPHSVDRGGLRPPTQWTVDDSGLSHDSIATS